MEHGFAVVRNRARGLLDILSLAEDSYFILAPGHNFSTEEFPQVWSIGDELVQILDYDPLTFRWSARRGFDGTEPLNHPQGSPVNLFVIASAVENLQWVVQQVMSFLVSTNDGVPIVGAHEALEVIATDPPSMTVNVLPGVALTTEEGDRKLAWVREQITLSGIDPPTTEPRIDVVTLDRVYGLQIVKGVEAASPTVPSVDSSTVPLAYIHHRVGELSIKDSDDSLNGYIEDVRAGL